MWEEKTPEGPWRSSITWLSVDDTDLLYQERERKRINTHKLSNDISTHWHNRHKCILTDKAQCWQCHTFMWHCLTHTKDTDETVTRIHKTYIHHSHFTERSLKARLDSLYKCQSVSLPTVTAQLLEDLLFQSFSIRDLSWPNRKWVGLRWGEKTQHKEVQYS